jgi:hypothetical protein
MTKYHSKIGQNKAIQTKKPNNIPTQNIQKRNNIESIFSTIKRKFHGINHS